MGRDSDGKRWALAAGKSHPKSEGPMSTPAIISLTTCDWPSLRKIQPVPRHTARMKASWRKKRTESSWADMVLGVNPAQRAGQSAWHRPSA
jgi:hypothetical protein